MDEEEDSFNGNKNRRDSLTSAAASESDSSNTQIAPETDRGKYFSKFLKLFPQTSPFQSFDKKNMIKILDFSNFLISKYFD